MGQQGYREVGALVRCRQDIAKLGKAYLLSISRDTLPDVRSILGVDRERGSVVMHQSVTSRS